MAEMLGLWAVVVPGEGSSWEGEDGETPRARGDAGLPRGERPGSPRCNGSAPRTPREGEDGRIPTATGEVEGEGEEGEEEEEEFSSFDCC